MFLQCLKSAAMCSLVHNMRNGSSIKNALTYSGTVIVICTSNCFVIHCIIREISHLKSYQIIKYCLVSYSPQQPLKLVKRFVNLIIILKQSSIKWLLKLISWRTKIYNTDTLNLFHILIGYLCRYYK